MSGISLGAGITVGAGIGLGAGLPVSIGYIDIFGNNFTSDIVMNRQNCLAYDSSNNLYAIGYIDNSGSLSATISKYNVNGAIQWQRSLGASSPRDTNFLGVDVDNSNNVYVSGFTRSDGTINGTDVQIAKYDTNGNLQWQKTLGSAGLAQQGVSMSVVKSTGDFYVVGISLASSGSPQYYRGLILKYNSSGVLQWQRSLTPSVSSNDVVTVGVSTDSLGNVYIIGNTITPSSSLGQGILVKYNSSGTIQWQVGLTKSSGQSSYDGIVIDSSNNIFVCGFALTGVGGTSYGIVSKYNTSGTLQWKKQIGDSGGNPYLNGISVDSSGNIYTTGFHSNNTSSILKYDTNGSLQWQRTVSASSYNINLYSISIDSSNNLVAGGYIGNSGNIQQILMVKVPNDGTPTGSYTASGISFTYSTSSLPQSDLSAWSTTTPSMSNADPSFSTATSTLTGATTTFTNSVTAII